MVVHTKMESDQLHIPEETLKPPATTEQLSTSAC